MSCCSVRLRSLVTAALAVVSVSCAVIADLPGGRLDPDASAGSGGTAGSAGNGGSTVSKYAAAVLSDNPVAYWRLGEKSAQTAFDASPNGHHGKYLGGPAPAKPGAIVDDDDTAVLFADPSEVDAGNLFDFAPDGTFTIEAWVKPTIEQNMFIGGKMAYDGSSHSGYFLIANLSTAGGGLISGYREPNAGYAQGGMLVVDQFSHVAVTFDGTYVSVYQNGEKVGSNPLSMPNLPITAHAEPFRIAKGDDWNGFTGLIDEFALYDYALGSRLLDHYRIGVGLE